MIKPQFSGPRSFAAEMVKIKKNMLKDICEKKNNIPSLSNDLKICFKKVYPRVNGERVANPYYVFLWFSILLETAQRFIPISEIPMI